MNLYIYPTDTVWGIGASIFDKGACEEVAKIKKSPPGKPLSILFSKTESLLENFHFPSFMDNSFLKEFFSLETTLGWPLSSIRIDIPPWITPNSDWVGIRCLERPWIEDIMQSAGGPVTTTSLNLSGERPCLNLTSARAFHKRHCPGASFIEGASSILSGRSSTIVLFSPSDSFERPHVRYLRRGEQVDKIISLLGRHQLGE